MWREEVRGRNGDAASRFVSLLRDNLAYTVTYISDSQNARSSLGAPVGMSPSKLPAIAACCCSYVSRGRTILINNE